MFDTYDASMLRKSSTGRWIIKDVELTCGSCIEVNIDDHWIRIGIEHRPSGYYAIQYAVRLHEGLWAIFLRGSLN